MFASTLLDKVSCDTVGPEMSVRVVGNREPPAKMILQVAIEGSAAVRLQGRIAKTAPWMDLGDLHTRSTLTHFEPVQYLRAVTSSVKAHSSVSVWAVWGW